MNTFQERFTLFYVRFQRIPGAHDMLYQNLFGINMKNIDNIVSV